MANNQYACLSNLPYAGMVLRGKIVVQHEIRGLTSFDVPIAIEI
jgi:hypothetical protein